jgi:superfamily I DNA/RNA helicase
MLPDSSSNATGTLEAIGQQDHNVTSEYRIFGPPGTGKTTNVTRQIRRAVDRYGPEGVLVTSFSRAAATELAGRDLPIAGDRVGTLHSHCWHALGGPEIAESQVDEWNRDNPHLAITPVKKQGKLDGEEAAEEDDGTAKAGDELLQQLNRFRGMMCDRRLWPATLIEFERRWSEYKRENGLLDFTDLIDVCLRDVHAAPKAPSVIFADEAQDLNAMQLNLVRKWGNRAEYFIIAGDDDQTIYAFTGATPDAFLDPDIPDDHKIILKQSYRVPRAVHGLADTLIHQVARRQEKVYLPRAEQGEVVRLTYGTYQSPDAFILNSAMEHLDRGKSVMFLTACSYMLKPLVSALRKNAVPFHNPYRKSNGAWNPLRFGKRGSTPSRILSLLVAHPDYGVEHRPWTHGDLALWAEWLQSKGILKHGAKKRLAAYTAESEATYEHLEEIFETAALESLVAAYGRGSCDLLDWWRSRVTADVHQRVQFPVEIAARRGAQALFETPRVVLGTIHSVKGGQADVVYLFPDLSQAGDAQYRRDGAPHDSVVRVFYVGATRARETLYICQRASGMAIGI